MLLVANMSVPHRLFQRDESVDQLALFGWKGSVTLPHTHTYRRISWLTTVNALYHQLSPHTDEIPVALSLSFFFSGNCLLAWWRPARNRAQGEEAAADDSPYLASQKLYFTRFLQRFNRLQCFPKLWLEISWHLPSSGRMNSPCQ